MELEWNWNGNGMENLRLTKTMCNGMEMDGKKYDKSVEAKFNEMEWKRNEKKKTYNYIGIRIQRNGIEVGYGEEMERKWNGNRMEFLLTNQVETNLYGMEWKWNGIEMETFQ